MKQIVAVDPGLNHCGVAVFTGDAPSLECAELVTNERVSTLLPSRWEGMALAVSAFVAQASSRLVHADRTLVIEMPKIYPASRQKGDPNDIVNLAGVVASIVALSLSDRVRLVYPRDWKGTIDADDFIEQRIKPAVRADEHRGIRLPSAASLQHNVWDAVGIGLHVVGRLEPKRVIAR